MSEFHHIRGSLVCQYLTSCCSRAWVIQQRIDGHERSWQPRYQLRHLYLVHHDLALLPPATRNKASYKPLLRIRCRYDTLKDSLSLTCGVMHVTYTHDQKLLHSPRRLSQFCLNFGLNLQQQARFSIHAIRNDMEFLI